MKIEVTNITLSLSFLHINPFENPETKVKEFFKSNFRCYDLEHNIVYELRFTQSDKDCMLSKNETFRLLCDTYKEGSQIVFDLDKAKADGCDVSSMLHLRTMTFERVVRP